MRHHVTLCDLMFTFVFGVRDLCTNCVRFVYGAGWSVYIVYTYCTSIQLSWKLGVRAKGTR